MKQLTCKHGNSVNEDSEGVDISNRTNEFGEEYHEYGIDFSPCDCNYSGSGWGEDYAGEIFKELAHHYKELKFIEEP